MNDNLLYYIYSEKESIAAVQSRLKELNSVLTRSGYPELEDLFSQNIFSVNKNIDVIFTIIEEKNKLLGSNIEFKKSLIKIEKDNFNLIEKNESSIEKFNECVKNNTFLKKKMINDEKTFKEEVEKFKNEKLECEKIISKFSIKENKFKLEIKRKEKDIEDLKFKLKKCLASGDGANEKGYNKLKETNETPNKNSQWFNIQHFQEFYDLIYKAFNNKIIHMSEEIKTLKEYFKLAMSSISDIIQYKKLILYKFSSDSVGDIDPTLNEKNPFINYNLFNLDFNDSKEQIINHFNQILNTFRFVIFYDILKVDETDEFSADLFENTIINKKFNLDSITFYSNMKKEFENLNSLCKESLLSLQAYPSILNTNQNKKMSMKIDEVFTEKKITEHKETHKIETAEILKEIYHEFDSALKFIDLKN